MHLQEDWFSLSAADDHECALCRATNESFGGLVASSSIRALHSGTFVLTYPRVLEPISSLLADAWAKRLAEEPSAAAAPVLAACRRAEGPDGKWNELLEIKLACKNARDARLLCACAFHIFRFETESDVVVIIQEKTKAQADRTRGRSGHGERGPDAEVFVTLLFHFKVRANSTDQKTIDVRRARFPPSGGLGLPIAIQMQAPYCKVQKVHDSTKVFIKLRGNVEECGAACVLDFLGVNGTMLSG